MSMLRRFGLNAAVLVGLTAVCTLFLTGGNTLYDRVQAERQRDLRMSILETFGENFTSETFDRVFAGTVAVEEKPKEKATVFRYQGRPTQSAVLLSGSGLWGIITMLVFFNTDTQTIAEIQVLSHSETPGLGSRIEEDWFRSQFQNLNYSIPVDIVSGGADEPHEVDAITGATRSSESVEAIINRAVALAGGDQ